MSEAANGPFVGIWQHMPSPMMSRFLGRMGWDWVVLDMQHGPMTLETAYECVHTLRAAGVRPLVRVPIGQPSEVEKALDIGARGIVVPTVNSTLEAGELAASAKYPPRGARSHGGDWGWLYGADYADRANDDTLLLVQIEHIDAVAEVESILGVEGVDGCFMGPTDLALSMGLPREGYASDPAHQQAMARTLEACLALGKLACSNTFSMDDFEEKVAMGFQGITFRSEIDLLLDEGTRLAKVLREKAGR